MATDEDYPIDLPILVIEAQIFVAVNKFQFLPNKLIPNANLNHRQLKKEPLTTFICSMHFCSAYMKHEQ